MNNTCRICGNKENNIPLIAKEMYFGMREEFLYYKCASCGCIQIASIPDNLSEYYRKGYSAHREVMQSHIFVQQIKHRIKQLIVLMNKFLPRSFPYLRQFTLYLDLLRNMGKTSSVLDVGCGNGTLLNNMAPWGFRNLTGIDAFIDQDIYYDSGVKVLKSDVCAFSLNNLTPPHNITEGYELIMMHHSFEHMANPYEVLNHLSTLLKPSGFLLIRIPMADSFAYRKYGVNWYQLDAPRHFFLYTVKSMSLLAKQCGFEIDRIEYDSTEYQFINSEKYCRDISLHEDYIVSSEYIKECRKAAHWLNKMKDGDQACFILRKQHVVNR